LTDTTQAAAGPHRSEQARLQREKRRAHILETAHRAFAANGYHATSVADLIEAAGVARGTFYLYFPSKFAIFEELVDDISLRLRSGIHRVDLSPGAPPAIEQLRANAVWLFSLLRSEPDLLRILLWEAPGLDVELDRKLASFHAEMFALTKRSLETGIAIGLLRDCDTEVGARCIVGALKELIVSMTVREDMQAVDLGELAAKVLDFMAGGLLVRND
jgi:AcrR family transcriptional regulator